jgi:hypothetical protein
VFDVVSARVLVLGRVVETEAWRGEGARSAGAWLSSVSGVGLGQAQALVDAAVALSDVPGVAAAVRRGALSEAQVREIVPAAVAAPDEADALLRSAREEAFGKLKARCAQARARSCSAEDDEARHRRLHDQRGLRIFQRADGAGRLEAGGVTALWNLRVPCEECHRRKTRDDLARVREQRAERAARAP